MADVIQKLIFKRGTKAALEAKLVGANKPLKGEPIFESDTNKFKIGNGLQDYKDLPYISGGEGPNEYIKTASVSGNTLTLTKQDGTTVVFTPEGAVYTAGNGIKITSNVISVDENYVAKKADLDTLASQVSAIASDYLKASDKVELVAQISAETSRATSVEASLSSRLTTVEAGLVAEASTRAAVDTTLSQRIDALEGRGRYLSNWDCTTGKPESYPSIPAGTTYNYKSGDYYIVNKVADSGNKKPDGAGIEHKSDGTWNVPSADETSAVQVGDIYTFDGEHWSLTHTPTAIWGKIGGTLSDQADLVAEFAKKQDILVSGTNIKTIHGISILGSGNIDVVGPKGDKGDKGDPGEKGDKGDTGAKGDKGDKGDQGIQGPQGPTGPQGPQGIQGEPGEQGPEGPQGPKGDTGATGPQGPKGEQGIQGPKGDTGEQGPKGDKGDKGDDGLTTKIHVNGSTYTHVEGTITLPDYSKVSVSGTGSSTEEAKYITIDGNEYKIAGTGSQPAPHYPVTYQTTINYGEDKIAAINVVTSGKVLYNGDIAIVKELFAGTAGEGTSKYEHTAFIYDNTVEEAGTYWKAMDGNYNAENVYFNEDLIYTAAIGVLPKPASSASLSAKGKNVKQVLSSILAQETDPSVEQPSLTISSSNIGAKEVGTTIGVQYGTSFYAGKYTYGPDTGITASNYQINFNGQTMTGTSGTFDNVQVNDSTSLKITGTFDHTQGAMPKTNLGNDCPSKRIAAQSAKAAGEKGTLSGYRKMFYGTFTNTDELTSDKIRSLTGIEQAAKSGNSLSVSIPVGAKRVVIAVPNDNTTITGKSWSRAVDSVKDVNDSSAEIISAFTNQYINVEGASNFQAIRYIVYICDYANPATAANTYKVNVK